MKHTIFWAIVILFPYVVLTALSVLSVCRAAKRRMPRTKCVVVELTEGL